MYVWWNLFVSGQNQLICSLKFGLLTDKLFADWLAEAEPDEENVAMLFLCETKNTKISVTL